jgi:hypothetical protein
MNCIECEEIISDYVDGALELGEQTKIEHHLANCESCRAVRDDLLQIVHFSKQLPLHTPASDLWTRIQSEIEAEQPKTFWSKVKVGWRNFNARDFNLTIPRMAVLAAAFVLMASVGAAVWSNINKNAAEFVNLSNPASGFTGPLNKNNPLHPDVVEFNAYEQRIKQLSESVEQKKEAWSPELRESFNRNLFNVDQSLKDCRQQLDNNPADAACIELMKNAYSEKMRVLEGFANF